MKSLYVHIPFCEKKCFYCSFAVSVGQKHRIDLYLDCLKKEAKQSYGTKIKTVYVGGGTPTLLNGGQLQRLFSVIKENFRFDTKAEWTIEANPEGLDQKKIKLLKRMGVNRVSLGIQTLKDKYLQYLGRNHNRQTALAAYSIIRKEGFDNVNLDLMYAFPNQTKEEFLKDLREIVELKSEHVSLYTLTIEKNSKFFAQNVQLKDNEYLAEQYFLATGFLNASGFLQYEISNFAKKRKESKHNLNYWLGGDYIGLGVGAHSHIQGRRFWNTSKLLEYIGCLQNNRSPIEGSENLDNQQRLIEILLFNLRMNQGSHLTDLQERFQCDLDQERLEKIEQFIKNGFLVREGDFLRATSMGRVVLDELCSHLI